MSNDSYFEAFINSQVYRPTREDGALAQEINGAACSLMPGTRVHWAGSIDKHTAIQSSDLDFWIEPPEPWTKTLRQQLAQKLTDQFGRRTRILSHAIRVERPNAPRADLAFCRATFGDRPPPAKEEFYNQPARQQAVRALKYWCRARSLPRVPGWAAEGLVLWQAQRTTQASGFAIFEGLLQWLSARASPQAVESILRPRAKPAWRPEWSVGLPGSLNALQNGARALLRRDLVLYPFISSEDVANWLDGSWTPPVKKPGVQGTPTSPKLKITPAKQGENKVREKAMSEQKPNDQRSNVNNPNSPDHKTAQDNRANQLNPNSEANKAARDNRANQLNPNHKPTKK